MMPQKVQIVLVLYKKRLEESTAFQDFINNSHCLEGINFELLLYNNSSNVVIDSRQDATVVNSVENKMLAGAYNFALEHAKRNKCNWLLLLDQDTTLNALYLSKIKDFVLNNRNDYVAAIPVIKQGVIHHSPIIYDVRKGPFLSYKKVESEQPLKEYECISGFNSGALLHVDYMLSVGGFSEYYPLDMLDHYYFLQIHRGNQRVKVLDAVIEQRLSLINIAEEMSIGRYKGYLVALKRFSKDLGSYSGLYLAIKLTKDAISQFIRKEKRIFFCETLKSLFIIN